jgi:XRE family transcriptional regulator, fatty acid utilization regulator
MKEPQKLVETEGLDLAMFGQRLRHARRARSLTLADLGARVGRTPSVLSLIENGRREPRLSLVEQIATALDVPVTELLKKQPPSRRAQLEVALSRAQRDPSYRALGLPELRVGTRVPSEILEHLVALATELRAQRAKPTATPEEARAANAALRGAMRERGNYFPDIEAAATAALERAGYVGGALSQGMLLSVVAQHGFSVRFVADLPRSVRSLTDLRTSRIYVKQEPVGDHSPRAVILQALGHFLLGHDTPRDFADFLRQRVEANYFAAAMLMPEPAAVPFLRAAKDRRDLAVEDLIDLFSVSYEMAAHRVTNLITHHLGVTCHFVKNDATGVIYKAYQNDGVLFPADASGAIEGIRRLRPLLALLPVLRHPVRDVLLRRPGRPEGGREGIRDQLRRPVRRLPLVPRPGIHDQDQVAVPGRRMLPARPRRPGRALGGPGVAVGPRAQPHPVGAPVRRLPRR